MELGNEIHGWLRRAKFALEELTGQDVTPPTALALGFVATEPIGHRPVAVLKVDGEPGIRLQANVIASA